MNDDLFNGNGERIISSCKYVIQIEDFQFSILANHQSIIKYLSLSVILGDPYLKCCDAESSQADL